jgi:tetratricopeptide (TPR) repeat protein
MIATSSISFRIASCLLILAPLLVSLSFAQTKNKEGFASIEGTVCDTQNHALARVIVSLEAIGSGQTLVAHTDDKGNYRFAALSAGTYKLQAKLPGYREASKAPLNLAPNKTTTVVLLLELDSAAQSSKLTAHPVEFSDEPEFSVAGVTDPTNLGGHGSDVIVRTKESLAKETVSLNRSAPDHLPSVPASKVGVDSAEFHALLGDIAEREGRPLEAVREYQRAAEMQPSEANLFSWGSELLLHRAPEPAGEVFTKGHRLFPSSARMLVGLAVASYARGSYEQASAQLLQACDLNPTDPSPYLFLGKIQEAQRVEPPGWTERLKRFVSLRPENPLAYYYYAVGLTKESDKKENFEMMELLLQKAIRLDGHFGDAYLQLGILYSERKDFPKAIAAYQKAIETTPLPDEAHFRLAEAYRQIGETRKARQEIEIYNQISKEKAKEADRERHEIQQFVYTLRGSSPPAQPPTSTP